MKPILIQKRQNATMFFILKSGIFNFVYFQFTERINFQKNDEKLPFWKISCARVCCSVFFTEKINRKLENDRKEIRGF